MADSLRKIRIDDQGIGTVLKNSHLMVPPNQREYSWTEEEILSLFEDLQKAIDDNQPTYFLGTIALTGQSPDLPEVTDGQQRLATTTILLAAMRDYYSEINDEFNCQYLESEYLRVADPAEQRYVPRLILNVDDRAYFAKHVVNRPGHASRLEKPTKKSHELIQAAFKLAKDRVKKIIDDYRKQGDKNKRLRHWVNYITNDALVIVLKLPSDLNAFKMFETLNNRGLRTTQVDIVKSYLFREGRDLMSDIQPAWSRMMGVLDSLDGNNVPLTFMRHFVITQTGMTRAEEVYEKIESTVSGKVRASEFIAEMEANANDYAAIMEPEHKKWNSYSQGVKSSLRTMKILGVIHTRPLMLAALRRFTPKETEKAFRLILNWTVRFQIVGGGRSGTLEESYSAAAQEITNGAIKNLKSLVAKLGTIVPADQSFKEAFAIARVQKNSLARYYLRALQLKQDGQTAEPEWVPNDDGSNINLEHVMPENPGKNWPDVTPDVLESFVTRLGNLALMKYSKNNELGNERFAVKREVLKHSGYSLTSQIGAEQKWHAEEITKRQNYLADLAVGTWPADIK